MCKAHSQVISSTQPIQLTVENHFACPIYIADRLEFLNSVNLVSEESLEHFRSQPVNEIYPVIMSNNYYEDLRVADFTSFISFTAWNILNDQGYAMHDKVMAFTEMWTQEHHKHSAMEQHTHGYGAQIVGFYFLEVPPNSSRIVFHDPRIAKTMVDLPQQDSNMATTASQMINFQPRPGMFIFTNAWLAHSFTRHADEQPIKFVHFNLAVQLASQQANAAEVI